MRDTYRRELQKIPVSRSGDAAIEPEENYTTWAHFSSMTFVRDQLRPRKMTGNLQPINQEPETPSDGEESTHEEFLDDSTVSTFEVSHPPADECAPPLEKKKKMTKNNHAERLLDIENKKLQLMEKKMAHKERDEDEAFLESLLPHLRKLTPLQKLRCRIELQNVVLEHAYPAGHNDDVNM